MSKVSITLEESNIRAVLSRKIVDCPEKEILMDSIMHIIADSNRLDKLMLGLLGTVPELKFKKGDEVWVKKGGLADHLFDEAQMVSKNMIVNGKVKGRIKETNPWVNTPYKIHYNYISKSDGIEKKGIAEVWESYVEVAEEFPEDLF